MPFEKWERGEELFLGIDREVDILDQDLRFWAEECDHMQGIQILMSTDDAWGGFGSRYLERARDEFGKLAIWVWGLEQESGAGQKVRWETNSVNLSLTVIQANNLIRTVNAAKSIHDTSVNASVYVPMSVPSLRLPQYVNIDRHSEWHTSGLIAMSLETMTIPSRLRLSHKHGDFEMIRAALNVNGNQRIANLQCSVPEPVSNSSGWQTGGRSDIENGSLDMDFFCGPVQPIQDHVFGQVESLRGFSKTDVEVDEGEGYMRKRSRLDSLPIIEKLVFAGFLWVS